MEAKVVKTQRSQRKRALGKVGICASCTKLAICRYPKSVQHPVMFCEEFSSSKASPCKREIPAEPVLLDAPVRAAVSWENFSNNYIGLCKRCSRLYACRLTKPGGGTWLCEFFEERTTTE
jgi:hypothetical protein